MMYYFKQYYVNKKMNGDIEQKYLLILVKFFKLLWLVLNLI